MWARFTVLNETPIASAIAGCVIPLSRINTIWMRSRCAAGIFHRSAVFSCRICFLLHLTIRPPESDSQSESYRAIECEPEKHPKPLDSISYGSGMRRNLQAHYTSPRTTDSTSSESDGVPEPTSQMGRAGAKAPPSEPPPPRHAANAYGSSASCIDLAADRKDALAVDDVSHDGPALDVERQARGGAIEHGRNIRDPPPIK